MTTAQRSKEVVPWECPVIQQHGQRADEFFAHPGADELWIICSLEECKFTEIYVRNPEPHEMACKVIGSVCVNIRKQHS